jgi:hypothetical protein
MTAVKKASPGGSSSSPSPLGPRPNNNIKRRAGMTTATTTALSVRRVLLGLSVAMGTALVAFHASVRPAGNDLHANPIRGGGGGGRGGRHGVVVPPPRGIRSATTQQSVAQRTKEDLHVNSPPAIRLPPKDPSSSSTPSGPLPARNGDNDASCKFRVRSVRDLQQCYPPHLVRKLPPGDCDRVTDWSDVQRCLHTIPSIHPNADNLPPKLPHYDISLIGERNSGTKFLIQELQQCFQRHACSHCQDPPGLSPAQALLPAAVLGRQLPAPDRDRVVP